MIGERLLDLRKDEGLTQDELAAILKINKHSVSSYERGKSEPPDDIKVLIAKHFNVSLDYLMGLIDEPLSYERGKNTIRIPDNIPERDIGLLKLYVNVLKDHYTKQHPQQSDAIFFD